MANSPCQLYPRPQGLAAATLPAQARPPPPPTPHASASASSATATSASINAPHHASAGQTPPYQCEHWSPRRNTQLPPPFRGKSTLRGKTPLSTTPSACSPSSAQTAIHRRPYRP
ncbi:uncharacterized protein K452DRAFT_65858 [Aplosporella prunicola CBS 121167]|uniref:Uncharacterized protein n=1 Tax=Aplosporella prunicola CBS 121167 TaxID=1176127 RepID=A0A6A6BUW4_9PEZI|nr:uncharacterized protein K452DRAFT_65858 [Aplosporella prunicola CBS 121167]KAF2146451.1 hypothetical protein K452DRAFT_65858 [Aplosporella prunicola CBS 121167]